MLVNRKQEAWQINALVFVNLAAVFIHNSIADSATACYIGLLCQFLFAYLNFLLLRGTAQ